MFLDKSRFYESNKRSKLNLLIVVTYASQDPAYQNQETAGKPPKSEEK